MSDKRSRLPQEVNRILFVRNLPIEVKPMDLYEFFGRYGAVRQIRVGKKDKGTKGTAYIVYEDIYDAYNAQNSLSGFNFHGRYLVIYYAKLSKKKNQENENINFDEKMNEINKLKKKHGIEDETNK